MLQKTVLSQQLNTFLDKTQWLAGHQMTSGLPADKREPTLYKKEGKAEDTN